MSKYYFNPKTSRMEVKRPIKEKARAYSSVISSQLNAGWTAPLTNAHAEFRGGIKQLRNQTRDLERSNSYAARFLPEWTTNIVGNGFTFQSLATNAQGREDLAARELIEEAWNDWKKPRNCTASGDMPYMELKALSERACARDGGVLIQKIKGWDKGDWPFALHLLEIDRLDVDFNVKANKQGNRIVMGKELDRYNRPVAYHLLGEHPGDTYGATSGRKRTRVDAKDIIHRFYRNRPESAHGQPLMTNCIESLRHLEKFQEAELIAARISACSTVAIERDASAPYEGDEYADQELTPGGKYELEPGERATLLAPQHPNSNFDGFRSAVLKGIAAGCNSAYPILSQDFSAVSYSSLRESKLNIRALTDTFRQWNIENEEEIIFRSWLGTCLNTGAISLPASNFKNFAKGSFIGKGQAWVDPLKDVAGLEKELAIGATSLSRAVKERLGISLETIIDERARDVEAFKKAGLPVPSAIASSDRSDSIAKTLQQIYLAVGTVITADEARKIVNENGGDLEASLPDVLKPDLSQPAESVI